MHVPDPKLSEIINVTFLSQSAESLESLLNNGNDSFEVSVSAKQQQVLMNLQQGMVKFPAVYVISRGQLVGVLGFVRNRILNWALELGNDGILGTGYSFSAEEERKAMSNQNINIHNFQGMIGNVSGSTVTQNLNQFVSPGDFDSLANYLIKQGVDEAEVHELERAIAEDPRPSSKESFGSGVSAWIGKMISKAASGAWAISVAAAGALLGGALSGYYGLK